MCGGRVGGGAVRVGSAGGQRGWAGEGGVDGGAAATQRTSTSRDTLVPTWDWNHERSDAHHIQPTPMCFTQPLPFLCPSHSRRDALPRAPGAPVTCIPPLHDLARPHPCLAIRGPWGGTTRLAGARTLGSAHSSAQAPSRTAEPRPSPLCNPGPQLRPYARRPGAPSQGAIGSRQWPRGEAHSTTQAGRSTGRARAASHCLMPPPHASALGPYAGCCSPTTQVTHSGLHRTL